MTAAIPQRVVMIGAGGHARVCLEALRDNPRHDVVGALSSDGSGIDGLDVAILGTDANLKILTERARATTAFVAIGDNALRARAAERLNEIGLPLAVAMSRFAAVSTTAEFAPGAAVLPGGTINAATSIGRGTVVNTNASVDHDTCIGDFVHVAPGVAIGGGCTIGDRTLVGIGARVLPNLTIGADVVIGGGAVVIDDVPDGTTVVGVPARPVAPT